MLPASVDAVEGGLALSDREALLVERPADDDAGEIALPQQPERPQVLAAADAAGVQEAAAHGVGDAAHLVGIRALEASVAVDVRVDERGDAAVLEPVDRVHGRQLGPLRPAGGGDAAAADVDRHDDSRAERLDDLVEEVDVAERGGADDRSLGPGAQRVADGLDGAQAAAVLHRDAGALDDPAQVLDRARLALLGAVEVDDVQVARAGVDPALGRLQRVVVVGGGVLEAALDEPHGAAAVDVDGRVEDHAATPTLAKLRSSARPSREDFSGWNWQPITLPRSTIDTNRSPYSPRPRTSSALAGTGASECTW